MTCFENSYVSFCGRYNASTQYHGEATICTHLLVRTSGFACYILYWYTKGQACRLSCARMANTYSYVIWKQSSYFPLSGPLNNDVDNYSDSISNIKIWFCTNIFPITLDSSVLILASYDTTWLRKHKCFRGTRLKSF